MTDRVKFFRAAGITIQVNSEYPITDQTFLPKFNQFEVDGPGSDNVIINHKFELIENSSYNFENNLIFSNQQWKIFQGNSYLVYQFKPVLPGEPGSQVTAVIQPDHSALDVYAGRLSESEYQNAQHNALSLFNSDQVLFSKLLCDRKGLILHANGFNYKGKGFLVAGRSGAGKSTISGMLKNSGFEILTDDRMFIRKQEQFWIHGSWCHGSVPDASPISAPLKAIFFLVQAKENRLEKIKDKGNVGKLLIQALVKPFLGRRDWIITLETLEEMVKDIDCFNVYFDLSGEITQQIGKLMESYEIS